MKQFLWDNRGAVAFGAYAVFSIIATALPDNLKDFDWRTYVPTVLKAISGAANNKFGISPKVKE